MCLSQQPENARSYAAPRTHQSLSLWKAAQGALFINTLYICIQIHKNLSVPCCIRSSILLAIMIPETEMFHLKGLKKDLASSSV